METAFIAIIAFVPMLVMLVVNHEWGHFFTAKAFGVKVLEFGIGYPPRAFSIFTGRTRVLLDDNTQYINLPGVAAIHPGLRVRLQTAEDASGNLVARVVEASQSSGRRRQSSLHDMGSDEYLQHEGTIKDIDPESLVVADMVYSLNWLPLGGFVRLAGENNPAVPRSLAAKGPGPRAIILAAGSLVNAAFPLFAFTLLFMIPQSVTVGQVQVEEVVANSPAMAAGIRPGDLVLTAGDRTIEHGSDLVRATTLNAGTSMDWLVEREGRTEIVRVTPRVNPPEGQGATGIRIGLVNLRSETRYEPPWTAVWLGTTNTWEIYPAPWALPQVTGEVTRDGGLRGWVVLSILFSINLAILNLLPIPMLDGGRLVFVLLEWVRGGKRIPADREGLVHLIGFVVLLGFILFITYNDIVRMVQGGSPLGG
ncbi:Zinc metalloprotease RasP [Geodia barretti]|uniref:Zinc metalloprotease RasP n=1 Tax=Geodia barretti TaxID=519541 RepID=A0AA35RHL3_GEOBA|nr:Zinc metalloprotease RasP [Geodia barretti]